MKMEKSYEGSDLNSRPAVDLFTLPPTDASVTSSNYIIVPASYGCRNSSKSSPPLFFSIPPSSSQYMDLNSSFLYVKAKIVRQNGTHLTASDIVAPSSMFFYAMFRNCIVSLNGTVVSDTSGQYAYQAGIPTLLMNGKDEKESELTAILNYHDTTPDVFNTTTNLGFKKRVEIAAQSKVFDMIGKIQSPLFQQERYLPTSCAVKVELRYQDPNICLDCATTSIAYDFIVESADLHVRMHTIHPEIFSAHNQLFTKSRAKYPLRSASVNTTSIASGTRTFKSDTMLTGKLPTTVVVGMVDGAVASGSLNKSLWNFQNFGLKQITLSADNDPTMTRTIEVDFSNKQYLLGYRTLFKAPGLGNLGNSISRDDYPSGYALFIFNLQDVFGAELHLFKSAYLRVSLQFNADLANPVVAVVYATTEELLELDDYRNVFMREALV